MKKMFFKSHNKKIWSDFSNKINYSSSPKISKFSKGIEIEWDDNTKGSFSYIWLMDNNELINQQTNQRFSETTKIPIDLSPSQIKIEHNELKIDWKGDGYQPTVYNLSILKNQSNNKNKKIDQRLEKEKSIKKKFWNQKTLMEDGIPSVNYNESNTDNGLLEMMKKLMMYGFVVVKDVPPTFNDTKAFCEKLAPFKGSIFGSFWEVTANKEIPDTAYTNLSLPLHTDGSYYYEPPGFQTIHVIEERTVGGESILSDGFYVSSLLEKDHFDTLSSFKVPFRYLDDGKYLLYNHTPILHLHPDQQMKRIVCNDLDRDVIQFDTLDSQYQFYEAYLSLLQKLCDPANQIKFKLTPGNLLIFDNWRVLHGRNYFDGFRKFVGCYFGKTEIESKFRILLSENKTA